MGITVNILIAKLNSHPGCGVAPDSGKPSSVKDYEAPSIRSQELFQRLSGPLLGLPGWQQWKNNRTWDMADGKFSGVAGIN